MAKRKHGPTPARLAIAGIAEYMRAGKSSVTVVTASDRFTYRVRRVHPEKDEFLFVDVLAGKSSYSYVGVIYLTGTSDSPFFSYRHSAKSKILAGSLSIRTFQAFLGQLKTGELTYEAWHDGRCGRCGRQLTDPVSLARGIGPTCDG